MSSPNKLYDAYALLKPVITNVPGDINNEVKIIILELQLILKIKDLAVAIKNYFRNLKGRKQMLIMPEKAEKTYSREIIIERYNDILKNILKNGS